MATSDPLGAFALTTVPQPPRPSQLTSVNWRVSVCKALTHHAHPHRSLPGLLVVIPPSNTLVILRHLTLGPLADLHDRLRGKHGVHATPSGEDLASAIGQL